MLAQKLKSFLNGGAAKAGVDGLQAAIDALESERAEVLHELADMPAKRADVMMRDDFATAVAALEQRERELYLANERIGLQIEALAPKLAEQRNVRRAGRIESHRAAYKAVIADLEVKLADAINANKAAIRCFESAASEFGEFEAAALFGRIHFAGLLNDECLEFWKRSLPGLDRAPTRPAPTVARPSRTETPVAPTSVHSRAVTANDVAYRPGPPAPRPARPPLPDVVPQGHVRVRVERSNYTSPAGETLVRGDELDLPIETARIAGVNGAVVFVEAKS